MGLEKLVNTGLDNCPCPSDLKLGISHDSVKQILKGSEEIHFFMEFGTPTFILGGVLSNRDDLTIQNQLQAMICLVLNIHLTIVKGWQLA